MKLISVMLKVAVQDNCTDEEVVTALKGILDMGDYDVDVPGGEFRTHWKILGTAVLEYPDVQEPTYPITPLALPEDYTEWNRQEDVCTRQHEEWHMEADRLLHESMEVH